MMALTYICIGTVMGWLISYVLNLERWQELRELRQQVDASSNLRLLDSAKRIGDNMEDTISKLYEKIGKLSAENKSLEAELSVYKQFYKSWKSTKTIGAEEAKLVEAFDHAQNDETMEDVIRVENTNRDQNNRFQSADGKTAEEKELEAYWRKELGQEIDEIAELLGVSKSTAQQYVSRGKKRMSTTYRANTGMSRITNDADDVHIIPSIYIDEYGSCTLDSNYYLTEQDEDEDDPSEGLGLRFISV